MTTKNINLKVPEAEHARMVALAEQEFMPLTSLLRRCFAEFERSKAPPPPAKPATPKLNKREQAFAKYVELLEDLPDEVPTEEAQRTLEYIKRLRAEGGNIHHEEMPIPQQVLHAVNMAVMISMGKSREEAERSLAVQSRYESMTLPELYEDQRIHGYNAARQHIITAKEQLASGELKLDE
jgi:hypothetical protein